MGLISDQSLFLTCSWHGCCCQSFVIGWSIPQTSLCSTHRPLNRCVILFIFPSLLRWTSRDVGVCCFMAGVVFIRVFGLSGGSSALPRAAAVGGSDGWIWSRHREKHTGSGLLWRPEPENQGPGAEDWTHTMQEVLWVHLLVQKWSAISDWGNYKAVCKNCSDGGLGSLWYTPQLHIRGPVLYWRTWRHDRGPRVVWSQTSSQKRSLGWCVHFERLLSCAGDLHQKQQCDHFHSLLRPSAGHQWPWGVQSTQHLPVCSV